MWKIGAVVLFAFLTFVGGAEAKTRLQLLSHCESPDNCAFGFFLQEDRGPRYVIPDDEWSGGGEGGVWERWIYRDPPSFDRQPTYPVEYGESGVVRRGRSIDRMPTNPIYRAPNGRVYHARPKWRSGGECGRKCQRRKLRRHLQQHN